MSVRQLITGAVVTVVIGGATYTVSQTDVISNFAKETGMSEQQAADYVNNIKEEDLATYGEIGDTYLDDAQFWQEEADSIDCVNYQYEWESPTLSCQEAVSQMQRTASASKALGNSYKTLESDSASRSDISTAIERIDAITATYDFEIAQYYFEEADIAEFKQTDAYNKSLFKAMLESEE